MKKLLHQSADLCITRPHCWPDASDIWRRLDQPAAFHPLKPPKPLSPSERGIPQTGRHFIPLSLRSERPQAVSLASSEETAHRWRATETKSKSSPQDEHSSARCLSLSHFGLSLAVVPSSRPPNHGKCSLTHHFVATCRSVMASFARLSFVGDLRTVTGHCLPAEPRGARSWSRALIPVPTQGGSLSERRVSRCHLVADPHLGLDLFREL